MAGNPVVHDDAYGGSYNINAGNLFNSPDGMMFDSTGLTWSGDKRTMFVGIQHPSAPFPDGDGMLPRSSIIAVKRDDGAMVG